MNNANIQHGGVDVRRDRATHRAGEANCKRPSEGGAPQNNHSGAIANPRDREVGHRNLMMLHCNIVPTAC
jgi:hypothetical protein